ncbi:MAG: hypothetical protein Q8Q49_06000 [bacterium]|nr:hypothetical protein [bacterium]
MKNAWEQGLSVLLDKRCNRRGLLSAVGIGGLGAFFQVKGLISLGEVGQDVYHINKIIDATPATPDEKQKAKDSMYDKDDIGPRTKDALTATGGGTVFEAAGLLAGRVIIKQYHRALTQYNQNPNTDPVTQNSEITNASNFS